MADAFQCDRCDDFEHGKPAAGVDVRGSLTPGVTNLDHPEESHHDARY